MDLVRELFFAAAGGSRECVIAVLFGNKHVGSSPSIGIILYVYFKLSTSKLKCAVTHLFNYMFQKLSALQQQG